MMSIASLKCGAFIVGVNGIFLYNLPGMRFLNLFLFFCLCRHIEMLIPSLMPPMMGKTDFEYTLYIVTATAHNLNIPAKVKTHQLSWYRSDVFSLI